MLEHLYLTNFDTRVPKCDWHQIGIIGYLIIFMSYKSDRPPLAVTSKNSRIDGGTQRKSSIGKYPEESDLKDVRDSDISILTKNQKKNIKRKKKRQEKAVIMSRNNNNINTNNYTINDVMEAVISTKSSINTIQNDITNIQNDITNIKTVQSEHTELLQETKKEQEHLTTKIDKNHESTINLIKSNESLIKSNESLIKSSESRVLWAIRFGKLDACTVIGGIIVVCVIFAMLLKFNVI